MTWSLKPKIPDGFSFDGELVYSSTSIEISPLLKGYIQSINLAGMDQFDLKYTGFESKKYKVANSNEKSIRIMLVGNLPRWVCDSLESLAKAVNGAGMIIQFYDDFFTGTEASPITYECRWLNAGDFVDNSELLCGGSIELFAFDSTNTVDIEVYQKVISNPVGDLEWELNIYDADASEIYYRVP